MLERPVYAANRHQGWYRARSAQVGSGCPPWSLADAFVFQGGALRGIESRSAGSPAGRGSGKRGEPRPVAGCNMSATLSLEQTVEVLRKHEGGT